MKASQVRSTMAALLVGGALAMTAAGCASREPPPPSAARTSPRSPGAPMAGVRKIGPSDQATHVTIRYGQQLVIAPAHQAGGWRVTEFPAGIVRPQSGTGPADSHVFVATSIGGGRITLTAGTSTYTVTVQVLRDLTQSSAP